MHVNLLEIAKIELEDAIDYYNYKSDGLGFEFAKEIRLTLDRITNFPDAWPKLSDHTRRARVTRFPYGIVYTHDESEILVLAVMHLHRKPEYWKSE